MMGFIIFGFVRCMGFSLVSGLVGAALFTGFGIILLLLPL